MHSDLRKLYKNVNDLFSWEVFLGEIEKRKKKVDNLLDDEAVALLLLDELGRYKSHITPISSLKEGGEYTVFGRVEAIDKPLEFTRHNGSTGRVINIRIKDNTGYCTLVLWDDDVDMVGDTIRVGSMVKIVNGYTRKRGNDIEINVGKWGTIEIEPEDAPQIAEEGDNRIEGILVKKGETRAFFKSDGEFDFVRDIWLKVKNKDMKVTVWGENAKAIQSINVGDSVTIYGFYRKNGEIHANSHSTITKS